ncbi:MAG: GNAT family N-acetyltransferase [Acidobacteriota bacterium]
MQITIREAAVDDLVFIIRMLADDFLGQQREQIADPLPEGYLKAFQEIVSDRNNHLFVAELSDRIVGTFHLTFTPSLSYQGGKRCTVESVRVDENLRGRGFGLQMMQWAIKRAGEEGCVSIQLTTNNQRNDAQRFYQGLGFESSHLGMKLRLR